MSTTLGQDGGSGQPVVLSARDREGHVYAIGVTKSGKTTLILNIILQDIAGGAGLCVIDPHGDLIDDILERIPAEREGDVILWEPFETGRPFGLNLFECSMVSDPNLVDRVCAEVMGTFYKLFSDSWGPQMADLLRATSLTLIYNQDLPYGERPTLAEVPALLTNDNYRSYLVSRVPDPWVSDFWAATYDPLKPTEKREYHRSSMNKVRRFLFNPTVRNIVGQGTSSIDFRAAMDEGLVLLINLAKGRLGEDNSALLGSLIVGKLLIAALSRADTPRSARRQFHLVVDEFQSFTTSSFATLQTEARKYGVDTLVAHQFRDQLTDPGSRGAALSVATKIIFKVNGADGGELSREFQITIPEPAVSNWRPTYTKAPHPLQHLADHGHQMTGAVAAYHKVHLYLTEIPAILENLLAVWKQYAYEEEKRKLAEVVRTASGVIEEQADRMLYQMMTCGSMECFYDYMPISLHKGFDRVYAGLFPDPEHEVYELIRKFREHFAYSLLPGCFEEKDEKPTVQRVRARELRGSRLQDRDEVFLISVCRLTAYEMKLNHLVLKLGELLHTSPCYVTTGQLEPVAEKPRTYADVAGELANTLVTLPPFTARVKTPRGEYTVQTYPAPPVAAGGRERAARLRARSQMRYGRCRETVEAQMGERGAVPEGVTLAGVPATIGSYAPHALSTAETGETHGLDYDEL